jgi:hypothetical protein
MEFTSDSSYTAVWSPPPSVEFDGHRFVCPGQHAVALIPILDLAYRARRGDRGAGALLTGFKVNIKDADGKMYWPAEVPVTGAGVSAEMRALALAALEGDAAAGRALIDVVQE